MWGTNGLCWHREVHPSALVEKHRLLVVRHIWVHDRTVAVSLNVTLQTLQGLAPTHLGLLLALQAPLGEALEVAEEAVSVCSVDKVEKRISNQGVAGEVKRGVEEVVGACEAMGIDECQEVVTTVIVGDVPPHHCCVRRRPVVAPGHWVGDSHCIAWILLWHGHDHDWACHHWGLLHHRHHHHRDHVLTIWHLHLKHATVIWSRDFHVLLFCTEISWGHEVCCSELPR